MSSVAVTKKSTEHCFKKEKAQPGGGWGGGESVKKQMLFTELGEERLLLQRTVSRKRALL